MAKQATQDKDYELAAIIRVHDGMSYGDAKITFSRRQPNGELWNFHYGEFSSLRISCQWDKSDSDYRKRGLPYAFHVEYTGETNLENFRVRAALLAKVEKGLARAYAKSGECETFGEYAIRVFNILGVEVVLEPRRNFDNGAAESGVMWTPSEIKGVFNRLLAGTLEVK